MADCVCNNFPAGLGPVTIGASLIVGTGSGGSVFPLVLQGGAVAQTHTSVIQFKAPNGAATWQLGAGGYTGVQQEFSLYDDEADAYRLYVGPSGNVGIGTVAPQAKLQVAGTLVADGNVGIGTTAPTTKLHVRSADDVASTIILQAVANNGVVGVGIGYSAIRLVGSVTNQNLAIDTNGTGHVVLQNGPGVASNVGIGTTAPQAKLQVAGSAVVDGNVGIGTTTPTTKLHVRSADDVEATTIVQALASNGELGIGIGFAAIRMVGSTANHRLQVDAKGTGDLLLQTVATGNVGIGRFPSTGSKLEVQGGFRAFGSIVADNASISTTGGLDITSSGKYYAVIDANSSRLIADKDGCYFA